PGDLYRRKMALSVGSGSGEHVGLVGRGWRAHPEHLSALAVSLLATRRLPVPALSYDARASGGYSSSSDSKTCQGVPTTSPLRACSPRSRISSLSCILDSRLHSGSGSSRPTAMRPLSRRASAVIVM